MPYINGLDREAYAPYSECEATGPGELNFQVTVLCDEYLGEHPNYAKINEVIGVLECAKLEMYRRVAARYEDKKCDLNGDVYTRRKDY